MYLDVQTVAGLLGVTVRAVQKQAQRGAFGPIRYEQGQGRSARRVLRIPLVGLPKQAQWRYLRSLKPTSPSSTHDGWDLLSEDRRKAAAARLEVIDEWSRFRLDHQDAENVHELADQFIRLFGGQYPDARIQSRSALFRWESRYREQGRMGLLDRRGGAPNGDAREDSIPEELWKAFLGAYLHQNKWTQRDCHLFVQGLARKKGLTCPSYRTFSRRLNQTVPKDMMDYARKGPKAWLHEWAPYVTRDREATAPGQVIEMDHFQLNLVARSPSGKLVRPFVTVTRDFRTGRYAGWCVGEVPSQYTVYSSAQMAFEDPDIGIPDDCILDNGREFLIQGFAGRGHRKRKARLELNEGEIRTLFDNLGVMPVFSIPENPTSKGGIERSFRVAEAFGKYWDSYVGDRPDNRPELASKIRKNPELAPDFMTVAKVFGMFVRDILNLKPSDAPHMHGLSPMQAWEQFKHERPVKRAPAEALRLLCMPTHAPYTVQKGGIRVTALGGMRYWSEELHDYSGRKVQVRYRQHDPSIVHCFDPKTGKHLCDAHAQYPIPHGATAEQIRTGRRKVARMAKKRRDFLRENAALVTGQDIFEGHQLALANNQVPTQERKVVQMAPISQEILEAARLISDQEGQSQNPETRRRRPGATAKSGSVRSAQSAPEDPGKDDFQKQIREMLERQHEQTRRQREETERQERERLKTLFR